MGKILINKNNTEERKIYIVPRNIEDYSDCIVVQFDLNENIFILERKNISLEELDYSNWTNEIDGSPASMLRYFFMSNEMRKVYLKHISK